MKTIATSIFLCRRRIPPFGSYELVLQNFHRISINTELLRIWFSSVEKQSNRGQIIELISFVNASGFNFSPCVIIRYDSRLYILAFQRERVNELLLVSERADMFR